MIRKVWGRYCRFSNVQAFLLCNGELDEGSGTIPSPVILIHTAQCTEIWLQAIQEMNKGTR
jgi:hypothetical protein